MDLSVFANIYFVNFQIVWNKKEVESEDWKQRFIDSTKLLNDAFQTGEKGGHWYLLWANKSQHNESKAKNSNRRISHRK